MENEFAFTPSHIHKTMELLKESFLITSHLEWDAIAELLDILSDNDRLTIINKINRNPVGVNIEDIGIQLSQLDKLKDNLSRLIDIGIIEKHNSIIKCGNNFNKVIILFEIIKKIIITMEESTEMENSIPYHSIINLSGFNLSHANFSGFNLSGADLSNANLSGADLSNANFSNANLFHVDLERFNPSNADFSNAFLRQCDLSNANLSNANFSNAFLWQCDLSNADLSNADLSNADLSNANLQKSILLHLKYSDINKLIINNETSFNNAITENKEIVNYLENQILKENMPILITNKEDLKKELENRGYNIKQVDYMVKHSKL